MARSQIIPTRMELQRLKRKLITAERGHKLLKDKLDELMRQFLELVRENMRLRLLVEGALAESGRDFSLARASMDSAVIETALLLPYQRLTVEAAEKNVMSVRIPKFSFSIRSGDSGSIYPYGFLSTSPDLDPALRSLSACLPDLLELAGVEKGCQLMAAEIEKTRRRVNALEHVIIPETRESIKYITMKLDENERSSQVRLMKIKDMMLEQAHHYSERAQETD